MVFTFQNLVSETSIPKSVAIVGGGIGGLALAHYLTQGGVEATVFENADQPGGVIRSRMCGPHLLEFGPQRVRMSGEIAALVEDLELGRELLTVPHDLPLYVLVSGGLRRVPFTFGQALRTDLLSPLGKLRALLEPLTGHGRGEESVRDYLVRKLGMEAYERVVGPLFAGLYASDPAEMPYSSALGLFKAMGIKRSLVTRYLKWSLTSRRTMAPAISFRGGMQTLPKAIGASLGDRLELGVEVERITGTPGRWVLELGQGSRGPFDTVVLTVPADTAASLLQSTPGAESEPLRSLTYNEVVCVHIASSTRPHGFGYRVGLREPVRTRGVTWNTSLFDRHDVFTAFLGGAFDPGILELDPEEQGAIAVREFEEVMKSPAEALAVSRARIPAWNKSWEMLSRVSLPSGIHLYANYESRPAVGSRIRGAKRLADMLVRG